MADKKRIIPVVTKDVERTEIPILLQQRQFLKEPSPRQAGIRVAEAIASSTDNAYFNSTSSVRYGFDPRFVSCGASSPLSCQIVSPAFRSRIVFSLVCESSRS